MNLPATFRDWHQYARERERCYVELRVNATTGKWRVYLPIDGECMQVNRIEDARMAAKQYGCKDIIL